MVAFILQAILLGGYFAYGVISQHSSTLIDSSVKSTGCLSQIPVLEVNSKADSNIPLPTNWVSTNMILGNSYKTLTNLFAITEKPVSTNNQIIACCCNLRHSTFEFGQIESQISLMKQFRI